MNVKKLINDFTLYSIEPIIFKIISFLLIPIYTNYLLPAEFGNLQYVITIGSFLRSISQFGLNTAFWKFRSELKKTEYPSLSFNILASQLFIGLIILIVTISVFSIRGFDLIAQALILYFIALLCKLFTENYLLVCRAYQKPKRYLLISLFQTVLFCLLNVLFVSQYDLGVNGVILAYLVAFCLSSIVFFPLMRKRVFGKLSLPLIKKLLAFGGPLLLGNFAILVLSISDRWFLKSMSTGQELGLYSYGYKFSDLILTFIVYTFQLAWTPIAWKSFASEKGRELFFRIEKFVMVVFPILAFVLVPIIIWLSFFMTSNHAFDEGLKIIFLISFSHVFYGYYSFNAIKNFYFNKKKQVIIVNIISAIINILLNWILIPNWGMLGAAISTIISYFLMFILIEFIKIDELTQFKKSRLKLFLFNIIALIAVIINSYVFYSTGSKTSVTISSIFTAGVLLIFTFATNIFNLNSIQDFILSYRSMRAKPANSSSSSENEPV